jgi:hypothetical protein
LSLHGLHSSRTLSHEIISKNIEMFAREPNRGRHQTDLMYLIAAIDLNKLDIHTLHMVGVNYRDL